MPTEPTGPAGGAVPPDWEDRNGATVEPGTYRVHVGVSADGKKDIEADLTVHGSNWTGSNYPVAYDGKEFAGIGVYHPVSVAGDCQMAAGGKPGAGETQLTQQLAQMPRSEIVRQPTPTHALGQSAVHLRLQVDAACADGAAYLVTDERGISYFDKSPTGSAIVTIDFWVLDVKGTTVVVDSFHTQDAPRSLVAQAAAARDSVTLVTIG